MGYTQLEEEREFLDALNRSPLLAGVYSIPGGDAPTSLHGTPDPRSSRLALPAHKPSREALETDSRRALILPLVESHSAPDRRAAKGPSKRDQ